MAKSIYECPHPPVPTIDRPHIATGHVQYCTVFEASTHGPDLRVKPAGQDKWFRGSRLPDSHKPRVSRVNRNVSGRVGSGGFEISGVGSGRVMSFSNITRRVGSIVS